MIETIHSDKVPKTPSEIIHISWVSRILSATVISYGTFERLFCSGDLTPWSYPFPFRTRS